MNLGAAPLSQVAGLPGAGEDTPVLQRSDLSPRRLLRTLRRLRAAGTRTLCVCCRDVEHQHAMFFLKLIAVCSGARLVRFLDPAGRSRDLTPARFLVRDLPLFIPEIAYALAAVLGFVTAALFLSLAAARRRHIPGERAAGSLCYLKTDFWFGLKAGGSVTHTREFIRAAAAEGREVVVIAPDSLEEYGLPVDVSVVAPARAMFDFPPVISQIEYNLRFVAGALRSLRGRRPALLYQRSSPNNLSGALLSRILRVPFVLEYNNRPRWSGQLGSDVRGSLLEEIVDRINLRAADRVAVVSAELASALTSAPADRARSPRPLPARRVLVNPNGVDTDVFRPDVPPAPRPAELPPGCPLIGFIGMFAQYHGVLTLAACAAHVLREEPTARFLIMGDGELAGEMKEILSRGGALHAVTFLGVVPHAEAPRYLALCDILVSPHEDMADGSRFFGSPTKIFEYMAMGRAIVTTRAGQLGEIFQDRRTAILVEQGSPRELARGIVELIRDPPLRAALGAEARRLAVSTYTWRNNFQRVMEGVSPRAAVSARSDRF